MSESFERTWVQANRPRAVVCLMLAASLFILPAPDFAQSVSVVQLLLDADNVLMPGVRQGVWREHVQLVWNGDAGRLERRHYKLFDPFADFAFDIFWR